MRHCRPVECSISTQRRINRFLQISCHLTPPFACLVCSILPTATTQLYLSLSFLFCIFERAEYLFTELFFALSPVSRPFPLLPDTVLNLNYVSHVTSPCI